jgi:PKHD-type hydroxylase
MMMIRNPNGDRIWEAYIENILSDESLKFVDEYISQHGLQPAGTVGIGDQDEIRKTNIRWIHMADDTLTFYNEIRNIVEMINRDKYNYQINKIEPLQYSEYEDGGHYTWHTDSVLRGEENDTRKISFSILLNDDFEGGELQLYKFGDKPDTMRMKKNSVVFFPSFMLHRVTPVTKGVRKALVGWVHGPNFI